MKNTSKNQFERTKTIVEIAISRPVLAWMITASLIIFGGISFTKMGVSHLPDVDFPEVSVDVELEGATPEIMEADVIDVIEEIVSGIDGVKKLYSSSRGRYGTVDVEFDLSHNIDTATQAISSKLARSMGRLPQAIKPIDISKSNTNDEPVMWLTLESESLSKRKLMMFIRDHLKSQLIAIPGVGGVRLAGYLEPNYRIWIDPEALKKYELTVLDLEKTLTNEHIQVPAGGLNLEGKEFNLKFNGEGKTVADLRNLLILSRGGTPNFANITLGQVAKIEPGIDDSRLISRVKGKNGIGIGIRKQRSANAVALGEAVSKKVESLSPLLPKGVKLEIAYDSTGFIKESVHELLFTFLLSIILTALVCWIFIGSVQSTLNVLLSIPTSALGTFIVLYFAGFTLNTFTLLAISLSIGIVVDDSIMVLENIMRYFEKGNSKVKSAILGTNEITFAAMATTIAVVAIFLPVVFMKGIVGRFFFQFGVALSVAVLLSLLEALTLTPMRCSQYLDPAHRTTRIGKLFELLFTKLTSAYQKSLAFCLVHRFKTVSIGVALFVLSLTTLYKLKTEVLPAEDQGKFSVRLELPLGTEIKTTDKATKIIEDYFSNRSEVQTHYSAVGTFDGDESQKSYVYVTLKPKSKRGISIEKNREITQQEFMEISKIEIQNRLDEKIFGKVELTLIDPSLKMFGGGGSQAIEYSIRGPDWNKLITHSKDVKSALEKVPMLKEVNTDFIEGIPELEILPNRKLAAARGISFVDLGHTIRLALGGANVGRLVEDGHRFDIKMKIDQSKNSEDINARLKNIFVRNNRGELVSLNEVVTVQKKTTIKEIVRVDRERAITVSANLAPNSSYLEAQAETEKIIKSILPEGYRYVSTGGTESFFNTFKDLFLILFIGVLIAYMVLASQFNSFKDPLIVLAALPFSISGALLALYYGGSSINLYSMIGVILLMGIVKKNSILIVDFANQLRITNRLSTFEALKQASITRFRPIAMTSTATIAGAIPALLSFGPGSESRSPMALAIVGGVAVSTFLTLYIVPCIYLLCYSSSEIPIYTSTESTSGVSNDFTGEVLPELALYDFTLADKSKNRREVESEL